MSPAAVTTLICAAAQLAGLAGAAAAVAANASARTTAKGMRRRRPTTGSHRPGLPPTLACGAVEFEITPEPTEEERAAIEAALAEPEDEPSPWVPPLLPGSEP